MSERDWKAEFLAIERELYPLSPMLSERPLEYLLRAIRDLKQQADPNRNRMRTAYEQEG